MSRAEIELAMAAGKSLLDKLSQVRAERDELRAEVGLMRHQRDNARRAEAEANANEDELRAATQALVDALPRCSQCDAPAVGETVRSKNYPGVTEPKYCDKHLPGEWSYRYGLAEPLRAVLALLGGDS